MPRIKSAAVARPQSVEASTSDPGADTVTLSRMPQPFCLPGHQRARSLPIPGMLSRHSVPATVGELEDNMDDQPQGFLGHQSRFFLPGHQKKALSLLRLSLAPLRRDVGGGHRLRTRVARLKNAQV